MVLRFEPTTFGTWVSSHNHYTRAPAHVMHQNTMEEQKLLSPHQGIDAIQYLRLGMYVRANLPLKLSNVMKSFPIKNI